MVRIQSQKNIAFLWIKLVLLVGCTYSESCDRKSTCSCECEEGMIDLKDLGSKSGAKYLDQAAQDGHKYSYNPCEPFTETSEGAVYDFCQNVAACQVLEVSNTIQYYDIGTQDSVTFSTAKAADMGIQDQADNVVVAKYVAADLGRQTEVVLVCNEQDDKTAIAAIGELPQPGTATYRFILVSPACCFIPVGALSAGTILIIICISLMAAYLIVGVMFKKFVSKATGTDVIPHARFWSSVPGLIRDGCLCIYKRGNYSAIT